MSDLVEKIHAALRARNMKLVTAESCTGGMLAAAMTAAPGASDIFERGFITYSNQSKHELLGVPLETLAQHGAVSEQAARAMAIGALKNSRADIAISVTGIAGPEGGSALKPVGLVYLGLARKDETAIKTLNLSGSRDHIRREAARLALEILAGFAS